MMGMGNATGGDQTSAQDTEGDDDYPIAAKSETVEDDSRHKHPLVKSAAVMLVLAFGLYGASRVSILLNGEPKQAEVAPVAVANTGLPKELPVPKSAVINVPTAASQSSTRALVNYSAPPASDIDTYSMCDLAVKYSLVSEDSFDSEWGGSFVANGPIGVAKRKFTATNGLGATMTSRYECEWDSRTDTIRSLVVIDPYGGRTKIR